MRRLDRAMTGLLVAQAVSITGTRMSMVALPWFVLVTTGSVVKTGVVAFAEMLPYVVVSVAASPVTDRVGARRTSIVCDVGSAVAVGLVPLLHAAGVLGFGVLLGLVAVAGALRGPGDNAKHVLLPAVAEGAGMPLERAAALYDGVNRVAGLVGAPVAGALIGLVGATGVLVVDAVTFLVAVAVVAGTAPAGGRTDSSASDDSRPDDSEPEGYRAQLAAGLTFLRGDRLLRGIALMLLLTNLLDMAMSGVLTPVWSRDEGHGAFGVGLLFGAFGVGATLGTLVMVGVGHRVPRRLTFLVCFLVAGAPRFFVMALGAPLAVAVAVSVLGGLAAGALNPILSAVELERIPERLRSRAIAAMTAVAWGGIPLGGLAGGWLAAQLGTTGALVACGGAYLLATLVPLAPSWGAMDRPAKHPTVPVDAPH
jgi:MFS family permease